MTDDSRLPPEARCLLPRIAPTTPKQLHAWLRHTLGIIVPRAPLIQGNSTPFDYLCHAFFEPHPEARAPDAAPPRDTVVWAARGSGKTFYAAVATALDLIFKPGIQIRILGGSLEQSRRMHEHLRAIFATPELEPLVGVTHTGRPAITERGITLGNSSHAETLAQSHTSLRGVRPHKLRCDEAELFAHDIWRAAQLTTRSETLGGIHVRGAIEALSTYHLPDGLMRELTANNSNTRTVFRWSIIDTLERCGQPAEDSTNPNPCAGCSLETDCQGAAGRVPPTEQGHVTVDDARRLKSRATADDWEAEMLCNPPTHAAPAGHAVIPEFSPDRHVSTTPPDLRRPVTIAGMDFGLRAPTVVLFALTERDAARRTPRQASKREPRNPHDTKPHTPFPAVYVVAEHIAADMLLDDHAHAIHTNPHVTRELLWIAADPAGQQRNDQTGITPVSLLAKHGLNVRTKRLPTDTGIRLIRARLGPAAGKATLTIHPRCTKLIESLRTYHYADTSPTRTTPAKNGPDHAVDALRYMLTMLDTASQTRVFG